MSSVVVMVPLLGVASTGLRAVPDCGSLGVARRERVMAGRDGVGVADPAVAAVRNDLASTGVVDDLAGAADGVRLRVVMAARALSAGLLDVPATARVRHDVPVGAAHLNLLLGLGSSIARDSITAPDHPLGEPMLRRRHGVLPLLEGRRALRCGVTSDRG